MSCPYQYYNDKETYYPNLYCKISGKGCLYRKRCDKVQKYIPIDGDEGCYILLENTKKSIPQGSYYVRIRKQGANGKYILFVEVGNDVVKEIRTNFTEFNQDYIYLSKDYTLYSLTPIVDKPKVVEVETKETEVETKVEKKTKSKKKKTEE